MGLTVYLADLWMMKLGEVVKTLEDRIKIQDDLDELEKWSRIYE